MGAPRVAALSREEATVRDRVLRAARQALGGPRRDEALDRARRTGLDAVLAEFLHAPAVARGGVASSFSATGAGDGRLPRGYHVLEGRGAVPVPRAVVKLYLPGMIHRVGAKGQVVIPKDLRDRVGLYPGAAVDFAIEDERIVLLPVPRQSQTRLGGRFAKSGMAARLLQDRAAEPR